MIHREKEGGPELGSIEERRLADMASVIMAFYSVLLNAGEAGPKWPTSSMKERINHALRGSISVEIEEHRRSLRLSCEV